MSFKPGVLEGFQKTARAQEAAGNSTHPVFDILAGEPLISKEDHFYWNAFLKLSKHRPLTLNGSARIPLEDMRDYAAHYRLTFEETELFMEIIEAMDDALLKVREDQADKKIDKSTDKAVKPGPRR